MQLVHVGGVVVYYDTLWPADPVLQHSYYPEMRAFNEQLANDPRVLASLVPLSYGITIAIKTINLDGLALDEARTSATDDKMRELLQSRRAAAVAELEEEPAEDVVEAEAPEAEPVTEEPAAPPVALKSARESAAEAEAAAAAAAEAGKKKRKRKKAAAK